MSGSKGISVLIAGGGGGGHFFSGVALGEAFLARCRENRIVYAGTRHGIEARLGPSLGLDVRFVSASPLRGQGLGGKLLALLRLPVAIAQSLAILLRERPAMVLGVGGYASFPVLLAARLAFRLTGIVEPNAVPGLANRILGRIVHRVFVASETARRGLPRSRTVVTGNPIRGRVVELLTLESTGTVGIGDRLKVLVLGCTEGARAINDAFVGLGDHIAPALRSKLFVIHQSGVQDEDRVRRAYRDSGIDAKVEPFIEDMGEAYRAADLVVCQPGGLTVSELMISRRGSILVPSRDVADNHQEINAQALVEAGAAEMILQSDLSAAKLADSLQRLCQSRRDLQLMAWRAGELARPQAAAEVVDEMYRAAGRP